MKLYRSILVFLSLFLYKSECVEYSVCPTALLAHTVEQNTPKCSICWEGFSYNDAVIPLTCNFLENHLLCEGCYKKLIKEPHAKCPECMQLIALTTKQKKLCETKDFSKNHCTKCFKQYPHTAEQSAICTQCLAQLTKVEIEPSNPLAFESISVDTQENSTPLLQKNENWLSNLKAIAGESSTAFIVALTARTLWDKGLLQHEQASERNAAWSTLAGSLIVSNRLLEYIQPKRNTKPEILGTSWLVGGMLGFITPALLKKYINNKKIPRK